MNEFLTDKSVHWIHRALGFAMFIPVCLLAVAHGAFGIGAIEQMKKSLSRRSK